MCRPLRSALTWEAPATASLAAPTRCTPSGDDRSLALQAERASDAAQSSSPPPTAVATAAARAASAESSAIGPGATRLALPQPRPPIFVLEAVRSLAPATWAALAMLGHALTPRQVHADVSVLPYAVALLQLCCKRDAYSLSHLDCSKHILLTPCQKLSSCKHCAYSGWVFDLLLAGRHVAAAAYSSTQCPAGVT